jgi:hypothetical protein
MAVAAPCGLRYLDPSPLAKGKRLFARGVPACAGSRLHKGLR